MNIDGYHRRDILMSEIRIILGKQNHFERMKAAGSDIGDYHIRSRIIAWVVPRGPLPGGVTRIAGGSAMATLARLSSNTSFKEQLITRESVCAHA